MCDCEFCRRVSDIQSKIDEYNAVLLKIDKLDTNFLRISSNLYRMDTCLDSYINTEGLEDIRYMLRTLDSDLVGVKNRYRLHINNKLVSLESEKESANLAARQHHEEERKKILENGLVKISSAELR